MLDRQKGEIVFECDGCSDTLETGEREFSEAKHALDAEGWRARKLGSDWMHYCPGCKE
jgi:hypothetical protein